jgi:perosamine synthetase
MQPETILHTLQSVLPKKQETIGLHEPLFQGHEWDYVKECLDTGWVSSVGKYVDQFERRLEDFTGIKHAVATVNGTAALHVCLQLAGVETGDEVLIPALTFIATANAVSYCGAIPHFVDSEETSLGMSVPKLAEYLGEIAEVSSQGTINRLTGRPLKAVVPMHAFGHPVDLEPLQELCEQYDLVLIEDAAESLGSYYKGRHTGSVGRLSALSFNGNKIITTGGGGAILTNDEELAREAKHITTTAKCPHRWEFYHDKIGYNYRLPNINAALGCAQLEELSSFLAAKRHLAQRYQQAFDTVNGVKFMQEPDYARSNYWLNTLILDEADLAQRDAVLQITNDAGYLTRPIWKPMHMLPMFSQSPRMDLSTTEALEKRVVNIPSSVQLGVAHG